MNNGESFGGTLTFRNLFLWAAALVRSPRVLFRKMDKEGGYLTPLLYALSWQFMAGILWLLVSFARPASAPLLLWGKIFLVVFGPGLVLFFGFVFSGVLFVLWHLMGSPFGYRTAFRVWALMSPLALLTAIPYVGYPALLFYGFFLIATASVETHGIRPRVAWTVWSILLAIFLLFQIAGVFLLAVTQRLQGAGGGFPSTGSGVFPMPPGEMPEDVRKKMQEDMDRAQAEFDRMQKENPPAKSPVVPPSPKPKK